MNFNAIFFEVSRSNSMIYFLLSFFSMINQNLYKNYKLGEVFHVNNDEFQINDENEQLIAKID